MLRSIKMSNNILLGRRGNFDCQEDGPDTKLVKLVDQDAGPSDSTDSSDVNTKDNSMTKVDPKLVAKYPQLFGPHTFAPKDLLALLKNLDNGIQQCEQNIKEENEKRRKYQVRLYLAQFFSHFDNGTVQVDDCRRTHNYDEFICTFLTMLAHEGKLADLVQEHLAQPKKQGAAAKGRKEKYEFLFIHIKIHFIYKFVLQQCEKESSFSNVY